VRLDGLGAQEEVVGDLRVGVAVGGELGDAPLARGR
jgi:hypothetical protein